MVCKDYESVNVTREVAMKEELEKLRKIHEREKRKRKLEPVNKGGRADIFKKRYS